MFAKIHLLFRDPSCARFIFAFLRAYTLQFILVIIVKKLNFKICGATFYSFQKEVSLVKTGDFNRKRCNKVLTITVL